MQSLAGIPVTGPSGAAPQLLGNLATISRGTEQGVVSHYDIQPVIDVYGDVQGRDLGGVAKDFERIVHAAEKKLPRGSTIIVRGQVEDDEVLLSRAGVRACSSPSCWFIC